MTAAAELNIDLSDVIDDAPVIVSAQDSKPKENLSISKIENKADDVADGVSEQSDNHDDAENLVSGNALQDQDTLNQSNDKADVNKQAGGVYKAPLSVHAGGEEVSGKGDSLKDDLENNKSDMEIGATDQNFVDVSNDGDADAPPAEFAAELSKAEKAAVSTSVWICVILILLAIGATFAILWPESKGSQGRIATLEQDVNGLRTDVKTVKTDVESVKEEQSFLTTLIPDDLDERIENLQEQARGLREGAGAAMEKAKEISTDVLSDDAGTMQERGAKLQVHMGELYNNPRFEALKARFAGMNKSLLGEQRLDQAVEKISALVAGSNGDDAQVNERLEIARAEDPALATALEDVPSQDLKAAAMLLGMTQFRKSLNRDKTPFQDDLALLIELVGEDKPELKAALERLAPQAEEGVLTPSGLTSEFKTMAGDVVVSSLKGEDVSVQDKAKARFNEIMSVEKDGELLTGTPTQTTVSKAENMLQSGDINGAISQMQLLGGEQAAMAQPWIEDAEMTVVAQQLQDMMKKLYGFGEGKLISDEASGINLYTPSHKLNVQ